MSKNLLGKHVITYDNHEGIIINQYKPTGKDMTVHIKESDGRIYYCPAMSGNCYSVKKPTKQEQIAINLKCQELGY